MVQDAPRDSGRCEKRLDSCVVYQGFKPELFKEIATNPLVLPWIKDDEAIEDFNFPDCFLYVIASLNGEDVGFFMLHKVNLITVEVHTIFHPKAFGKVLSFSTQVIDWVFSNTDYEKMITHVPEDNPKAKRLAEKSGMEVEGIIKKSFRRNGQNIDQFILGVSKCQQ